MTVPNTKTLRELAKNYSREILTAALLIFAYFPTLVWMWDRWFAKDSYYSHGILIPFVSGYLIWQKRGVLKQIPLKRSRSGLALIVAGIIIHVLSSLFRVYFTSGFSLLIVLVGLILSFYGKQVLRQILFPVMFLFFMFPLPLVVVVNLSFKMKLFAAQIANDLLNSMGIYAIRHGSVIRMQHAYVIVDDVCSGLRSLISLAALGSIFAYWLNGPMWKRLTLFLMTIPIAIITNVCRVVLLAAVSEIWGAEQASGFVHDASGFMVFVLAFIMLFVVSKVME